MTGGVDGVEERLGALTLDSAPAEQPAARCDAAYPSATLPVAPGGGGADGDATDPHATDLLWFHQFADFERQVQGNFARVRKLVKAIHGVVYLYQWERAGQPPSEVVVKLMPTQNVRTNVNAEANELRAHLGASAAGRATPSAGSGRRYGPCDSSAIPHQEDALNEIGIITFLYRQADCPRYLLRLIDSFHEGPNTWLVTEFADGGEFFDQVASARIELSAARIRIYMWQLLQAVRYLHGHCIGHRDISLENILITFKRDAPGSRIGEFRLMDFGGACRTHSPQGQALRYFRPVGKAYYRAPECLVPATADTEVVPPAGAEPSSVIFARLAHPAHRGYLCEVLLSPGATPGQLSAAQVWGYTVPPMDVFACGVCFFIMSWGVPPWQAARLTDELFVFVSRRENGVAELLRQWRKAPLAEASGMDLLTRMLRVNPSQRPSIEQCLASEWFAPLAGMEVPRHSE